MRPTRFTVSQGKTTFHYPFSFLREFISLGKKEGNVGIILIGRCGEMFSYKGFGTIDNPRTNMITFHMKHFALMSGPLPSDEEQLIERESPFKYAGMFYPKS